MKKSIILFLLFWLLFTSCEESLSERETRREKERLAKKEIVKEQSIILGEGIVIPTLQTVVEEVNKVFQVTYTTVSTDSSYWYVRFTDDKSNWHGMAKLATPYFDFVEIKKQFPKTKGKMFFSTIVQLNRESYESWVKFKVLQRSEE